MLVVDVCTHASGRVLHEGVGEFNPIIVVYEEPDGTSRAGIGFVMSYYEFIEDDFTRITDSEWKERVENDTLPPRPSWTGSFLYSAESACLLQSIAASPPSVTLAVGETLQLTITATYSDGSTADVTADASYESSDTWVATVSDAGLITGVAAVCGEMSATITASYTEGGVTKTDTVSVTVFSGWKYDANGDGVISKAEAITAVVDYFDGVITKELALEVVALYFAS